MVKDKESEFRFTWNIHYECNYRCPYCFFDGKWAEYKKRNIYLSPEEWMKRWKNIHEKYGRCYILITGGEPFIYPGFIDLLEGLSQIHYPINISTNTSGDLDAFVRRIDPLRVSVSVSFQPYFENLESFLKKLQVLRKHKFDGCVNFVAYPPVLKMVEKYRKELSSTGEELKVIPFWGRYEEKEYPFAYTQQEKEMIGISDSWFTNVRRKGSLCPAGYNSALIFPDGSVARCGQIGEKVSLGNFLDTDFSLLDKPSPCEAEYCPCDEGKLFGDKESLERKELTAKEENNRQPTATEEKDVDRALASVTRHQERPSADISFIGNRIEAIRDNSARNEKEFASGKTVLSSYPKTVFIQAAGPCNSSCVFCSRGPKYEFFDLKSHRERFEKSLYPVMACAESLVLTGSGEFLQLPGAPEIIDFFDTKFANTEKVFSTNGSSLVPWACEKIVNSPSRYTIHVSLHASNAVLHKVMTRMDNFDRIISQVRHLVRVRKEKGRPAVNLIFVATTLNIEDLPDFIRLAKDTGADKVICYYNYIYVHAQKYLSCFFKQELTNAVFSQAEALAKKLDVQLVLPPKFGQKDYPRVGVCREPFSQIMFDSEGRVLPCDASQDCPEILSGSRTFMEVWNGEYYQKLRKSMLEGRYSCFRHCLRANPASVNDFKSHLIRRGIGNEADLDVFWGDNF
jgi:MoaA/NifB/PqqE/SkfB family radical SAM enzyme